MVFGVDEYWIMNTGQHKQVLIVVIIQATTTRIVETHDFLKFDWLDYWSSLTLHRWSRGQRSATVQRPCGRLDIVTWLWTFKQHGYFAESGSETNRQEVWHNCPFDAVWFGLHTSVKVIFQKKRWKCSWAAPSSGSAVKSSFLLWAVGPVAQSTWC